MSRSLNKITNNVDNGRRQRSQKVNFTHITTLINKKNYWITRRNSNNQ